MRSVSSGSDRQRTDAVSIRRLRLFVFSFRLVFGIVGMQLPRSCAILVVILPVLPKSSSFPVRSSSSSTFFVSVSIPMIFLLPGVRETRIRVGTAVILSVRARPGLFNRSITVIRYFPGTYSSQIFFDVLVRGETPGCPVSDIEPKVNKVSPSPSPRCFSPFFHGVHIL